MYNQPLPRCRAAALFGPLYFVGAVAPTRLRCKRMFQRICEDREAFAHRRGKPQATVFEVCRMLYFSHVSNSAVGFLAEERGPGKGNRFFSKKRGSFPRICDPLPHPHPDLTTDKKPNPPPNKPHDTGRDHPSSGAIVNSAPTLRKAVTSSPSMRLSVMTAVAFSRPVMREKEAEPNLL